MELLHMYPTISRRSFVLLDRRSVSSSAALPADVLFELCAVSIQDYLEARSYLSTLEQHIRRK